MIPFSRWDAPSRAALCFAGVGFLVLVLASWGAWRVSLAEEAAGPGTRAIDLPRLSEPAPELGDSLVAAIAERHPFRADRSPPPERYRLPEMRWTGDPGSPTRASGSGRFPDLVLLGTAAYAEDRGSAAFRLRGRDTRLVSVGDTVQGFRLVAVEHGRVTLSGSDTTLILGFETRQEGGFP